MQTVAAHIWSKILVGKAWREQIEYNKSELKQAQFLIGDLNNKTITTWIVRNHTYSMSTTTKQKRLMIEMQLHEPEHVTFRSSFV